MKRIAWFGWIFAAAVASLSGQSEINRFFETFSADWLRADPQRATELQYFSGDEQDRIDRLLTPATEAFRAERVALAQRGLEQLKAWPRESLPPAERISAATLAWQLDSVIQNAQYSEYEYVFDQFRGLQVRLVNFLSQTHPIRNRRDIENYLARLEQVATVIDQGIVVATARAEKGIFPPKFILSATLQQFDRFLEGGPRKNVLVASLDERIAKIKDLPPLDERTAWLAQAEKAVGDSIIPAYRRARALLESQLAHATDKAGLGRFENGAEVYAARLHAMTTTELKATEIHEMGLREVARIEAEMDRLLRELGYKEGTIKARMEALEIASQPSAEPDPRPGLLARFEEILRDAERRADVVFDLRPKAPVVVKREPFFTEKTAAAHYTPPAKDGSIPGIFWAPLPGPNYQTTEMRTLVYHEAVPGHHFQIALQGEDKELPRFRADSVFGVISAHAEGWALYAEQLAAENGWYEGDIQGHLGQLNAELFRARRLVVDTGLHAMHWTRQQAIDYGIRPAEVDRYVVWPGQACSYKIGMLKILELREKAKRELGPKFSMKQFHNVVLRAGGVPLGVLSQVVDDYIQVEKVSRDK